ncbi:MAG: glutamate--tRNA ligase [Alphaproteobacteria bacterium]|nr:glutamate--tRNA ligase [Alphaproteobacteria bacterium]
MKKELVERLIGKDVKDISFWAKKFPKRPDGMIVTRFAPSPTGFLHIGAISTCQINEKLAHQSGGKILLRIEDTDTKREVEGTTSLIIEAFKKFNMFFDEGPISDTEETGEYGPYFQSQRKDIYLSGVKYLLEQDWAYPCFSTEEELDAIRKEQTVLKFRTGYYGKWAKYRNFPEEMVEKYLDEGRPYIIRFKSNGDWNNKRYFDDGIRGKVSMPENDIDIVILKSDGLPTYHFAHVIDDHFMGTTHVIRSDEWLASLPLHVQMFETIGFEAPKYVHLSPIQKLDDGNRRKLSKRKDPEANVEFYLQEGYPVEAVKEYLMNIANSDFEEFRKANPINAVEKFELKIDKLNNSGALLDFLKLDSVAKEYISTLSSSELYDKLLNWAKEYDTAFAEVMKNEEAYLKSILAIERDGVEKVRKDFYIYSKIKDEVSYFFKDKFSFDVKDFPVSLENARELVEAYKNLYVHEDVKENWFPKVKDLAEKLGYAKNPKELAKTPEAYKGTVADVACVIRILITGRAQSPDLYTVMQILGKEETLKRLNAKI